MSQNLKVPTPPTTPTSCTQSSLNICQGQLETKCDCRLCNSLNSDISIENNKNNKIKKINKGRFFYFDDSFEDKNRFSSISSSENTNINHTNEKKDSVTSTLPTWNDSDNFLPSEYAPNITSLPLSSNFSTIF